MNFANLFKKRIKSLKPKAAVFVDYEHWFFSYLNNYHIKPNIREWYDSLTKEYDISDIFVFGDFSKGEIKYEVSRIREITSHIIETQNTNAFHKKDFTDFIMLDFIYQKAIDADDITDFILFTGDGHFHSVTKYLTTKRKKNVIIYGVKNSLSNSLKTAATSFIEMPQQEVEMNQYYKMIISNLDRLATSGTDRHPTFRRTVQAVAQYNNVSESAIQLALQDMIEKKYLSQKSININHATQLRVLVVNWDKLIDDNLWSPPSDEKNYATAIAR